MRQLEIKHGGYSLTITEATALMGMRHSILREEMAMQVKPDDDPALIYLKRIFYPALVSAVKEQAGFANWPVTFEEFIELPDQLAGAWEKATFELNPHWQPGWEAAKPEEKKEYTSVS